MAPHVIVIGSANILSEYPRVPGLHEMQSIVAGYVEGIRLPEGMYGFVNEEGAMRGMPHNPAASRIAGQSLYGSLIVTGGTNEEGEIRQLTDHQYEALQLLMIGG